jgi:hypothetical protein
MLRSALRHTGSIIYNRLMPTADSLSANALLPLLQQGLAFQLPSHEPFTPKDAYGA